jgi:hypothetical protein
MKISVNLKILNNYLDRVSKIKTAREVLAYRRQLEEKKKTKSIIGI